MQCNAMHCNAMQCNAIQCNAMQCNVIVYFCFVLLRDGIDRFYWAGNDSSLQVCPCNATGDCFNPEDRCNCDANDEVLREDAGYITLMSDLPISAFRAGDTGITVNSSHII